MTYKSFQTSIDDDCFIVFSLITLEESMENSRTLFNGLDSVTFGKDHSQSIFLLYVKINVETC